MVLALLRDDFTVICPIWRYYIKILTKQNDYKNHNLRYLLVLIVQIQTMGMEQMEVWQ